MEYMHVTYSTPVSMHLILTCTNKAIQYVSTVTAALITSWSIATYLMTWYIITLIDIYYIIEIADGKSNSSKSVAIQFTRELLTYHYKCFHHHQVHIHHYKSSDNHHQHWYKCDHKEMINTHQYLQS